MLSQKSRRTVYIYTVMTQSLHDKVSQKKDPIYKNSFYVFICLVLKHSLICAEINHIGFSLNYQERGETISSYLVKQRKYAVKTEG